MSGVRVGSCSDGVPGAVAWNPHRTRFQARTRPAQLLPAGSAHTAHWACLFPSHPLLRAPVCPSLHE